MKNIHIIPTEKPSRLAYDFDKLVLNSRLLSPILYKTQNIYITSDEEIKEGYYLDLTHNVIMKSVFYPSSDKNCKKIILTTDTNLIKDGVQAIPDEFLEWFVKNPSCEFVNIVPYDGYNKERGYYFGYEIIIPKEETKQSIKDIILSETPESVKQKVREAANALVNKQETFEETIDKASLLEFPIKEWYRSDDYNREEITAARDGFKRGAKWQQERSYSDKEVYDLMDKREHYWVRYKNYYAQSYIPFDEWFEQFKKKLL